MTNAQTPEPQRLDTQYVPPRADYRPPQQEWQTSQAANGSEQESEQGAALPVRPASAQPTPPPAAAPNEQGAPPPVAGPTGAAGDAAGQYQARVPWGRAETNDHHAEGSGNHQLDPRVNYAPPQANYGPPPPNYGPAQFNYEAPQTGWAHYNPESGAHRAAAFDSPAAAALGASLASSLQQEAFSTPPKPRPQSGWRKGVLKSSFGLINPGESPTEREDRHRIECIRANIPREAFVYAVMSARGGVSKTTTTAAIGSVFARVRGAEVVGLDACRDEGNLASRVNPAAKHTFEDILRNRQGLRGDLNNLRVYTKSNDVHFDVLAASEAHVDPATYDPQTLTETVDVLRTAYRVIGIDCGQNIHDPVTSAILDLATAVVVVTGVQFDSGYAALRLYDWMRANGRTELLNRSVLVMSDRSPKAAPQVRAAVEEAVNGMVWENPIYVPYDPHLHEAGVIRLEALRRPTYRAYLAAAGRLSEFYGLPATGRREA